MGDGTWTGQPGAGWWLASDGHWYPPESHPNYQDPAPAAPPRAHARSAAGTPPPSPPAAPIGRIRPWDGETIEAPPPTTADTHSPAPFFAVPAGIGTAFAAWVQALLWINAGASALAALTAANTLFAYNEFMEAPAGSRTEAQALSRLLDAEVAMDGAMSLILLAWLPAFVLVVIWMNKAHKATQLLWRGPRQFTSGWTVGGWFIPIGQLWIPLLVLNEIERLATAPRAGGAVTPQWRNQRLSGFGAWWWICLLGAAALPAVGASIAADAEFELDVAYSLVAAGYTSAAIAGVLGAAHLRSLSRLLSPMGLSTHS